MAPPETRLAWMLSKLVPNWSVALGTTVHMRAMECVTACLAGRALPSFRTLRRASASDLNRLFAVSWRHLERFRESPDRSPALADAYYGAPADPEAVARTSARLDAMLDRLLGQQWLWDAIRAAAPGDTVLVDRFYSFVLPSSHLTVFAAPDLVLRRRHGAPMEIWDFKTGHPDGAVDQLLTYALAARDGLGVGPVDGGYLAGIVALAAPDVAVAGSCETPVEEGVPFLVIEQDVDAAAGRVRESAAEMRAVLRDPERNAPMEIGAFPRTKHRWRCPHCQFRGLCEPDVYPTVDALP
jgi:hypothetical protein